MFCNFCLYGNFDPSCAVLIIRLSTSGRVKTLLYQWQLCDWWSKPKNTCLSTNQSFYSWMFFFFFFILLGPYFLWGCWLHDQCTNSKFFLHNSSTCIAIIVMLLVPYQKWFLQAGHYATKRTSLRSVASDLERPLLAGYVDGSLLFWFIYWQEV